MPILAQPGYVSRARITQVMNLLPLAPDTGVGQQFTLAQLQEVIQPGNPVPHGDGLAVAPGVRRGRGRRRRSGSESRSVPWWWFFATPASARRGRLQVQVVIPKSGLVAPARRTMTSAATEFFEQCGQLRRAVEAVLVDDSNEDEQPRSWAFCRIVSAKHTLGSSACEKAVTGQDSPKAVAPRVTT
jgi:hypothetical protein